MRCLGVSVWSSLVGTWNKGTKKGYSRLCGLGGAGAGDLAGGLPVNASLDDASARTITMN